MPKSKRKNRLNTTIDKDLLKQFKILAVQEDKRLNQLLEESIRDVLAKYKSKPSSKTKSSAPKQEKREQEEDAPSSLSLQTVETALNEMVKELKDTRRALERGPKKISSLIPALSGLVVGLILSGLFFTASYSDLLRYKFDLDARAIMLSHSEDSSTKAANVGVIRDSIIDESRELTATNPATSAGILPASEFPPLAEFFSLKLNAIAWDENPEQRLAVIGDRIVHEGDLVGGSTVLRINQDHIVFSDRGAVFIKEINSEQ
ncbi:MAG: general secretion pathway protein GspB [Deltaproteobacteria bacterium]|nr:general secretion pathway protein GspB [Deltaproteobacteria bacterium]